MFFGFFPDLSRSYPDVPLSCPRVSLDVYPHRRNPNRHSLGLKAPSVDLRVGVPPPPRLVSPEGHFDFFFGNDWRLEYGSAK